VGISSRTSSLSRTSKVVEPNDGCVQFTSVYTQIVGPQKEKDHSCLTGMIVENDYTSQRVEAKPSRQERSFPIGVKSSNSTVSRIRKRSAMQSQTMLKNPYSIQYTNA
jgi:hypothetical protein